MKKKFEKALNELKDKKTPEINETYQIQWRIC